MKILFLIISLNWFLIQKPITYPYKLEIPKSTNCKEIIYHQFYSLCYNEYNEQASWVAYKLTKDMIIKKAKRNKRFNEDKQVKTKSASSLDYKNSGYDRGHLCPAADMSFSEEAMKETFYMSNISPQNKEFNRGIWKQLEENVRKWVNRDKVLYIVTGTIFLNNNNFIGIKNRVGVPDLFYKAILDITPPEYKVIGFIIPNKKDNFKEIQDYVVTIDFIEKVTNLDLFYKLNDSIESKLEKSSNYNKWDY